MHSDPIPDHVRDEICALIRLTDGATRAAALIDMPQGRLRYWMKAQGRLSAPRFAAKRPPGRYQRSPRPKHPPSPLTSGQINDRLVVGIWPADVTWRLHRSLSPSAAYKIRGKKMEKAAMAKKQFWIVGGEYTDMTFSVLDDGKAERHGPFASYEEAYVKWNERARATIDICQARFRIERDVA
jgi:hypothetical protein